MVQRLAVGGGSKLVISCMLVGLFAIPTYAEKVPIDEAKMHRFFQVRNLIQSKAQDLKGRQPKDKRIKAADLRRIYSSSKAEVDTFIDTVDLTLKADADLNASAQQLEGSLRLLEGYKKSLLLLDPDEPKFGSIQMDVVEGLVSSIMDLWIKYRKVSDERSDKMRKDIADDLERKRLPAFDNL